MRLCRLRVARREQGEARLRVLAAGPSALGGTHVSRSLADGRLTLPDRTLLARFSGLTPLTEPVPLTAKH